MPRDGNGVFQDLPGLEGVPNQPIESADWNNYRADIAQDLNTARPVTAGGTGATSAMGAFDNITTKGADISSAATLNLDNATGYFIFVSGNTGITAVTLAAGRQRMVRFTGAPLITVGANLTGNNGGRNIQVEIGDMAIFEGYPGDAVQFWLVRANGGPVEQVGTTLTLTSTDASNAIGPTVILDRNSDSPAANDGLGKITFNGRTSTGLTRPYAEIWSTITSPTNGDEAGEFIIRARGSGGAGSRDYRFTQRGLIGPIGDIQDLVNGKVTAWLKNGSLGLADFGDYVGAPIATLVGGTNAGALIEGAVGGHMVFGIRDNDAGDSFSIVSYNGAGAYSRLVAAFRANGAVEIPTLSATTFSASSTVNFGTFSATGATAGKQIIASNMDSSHTLATSGFHQRFYNPNGQVGSITTNASATAFNTSSDETLKDFIGVYDPLEALAIIRADPTREFTWRADGTRAIGWGAQTSYAVSADLATPGVGNPGDEDYTPWGVDQGKRTPYLWAVVPWLADRLDAVEARLSAAGL